MGNVTYSRVLWIGSWNFCCLGAFGYWGRAAKNIRVLAPRCQRTNQAGPTVGTLRADFMCELVALKVVDSLARDLPGPQGSCVPVHSGFGVGTCI